MNRAAVAADPGPLSRRVKLAYLVSHPIQYQAPLLRLLSAQPDIELTVFFQSDLSVKGYFDGGFGRRVEWDVPLLDGYRYEFLPALGRRDRIDGLKPYNYGIATRLWCGGFDFLWVHGYARWFSWAAMAAARLASIPVLMRDEATAISADRSPAKQQAKRIFFATLGAMCEGFLAIGSLNRQYYIENGIDPERIHVVPYCVDNAYFAERAAAAAPRRDQLRAELGLAPGRPVILFASKFLRRKRAEDVLAAFELLIGRPPGGRKPYLLFAGDGEARPEVEARARPLAEDVRFLGFRNQTELPALFDLCDVFVLPSELEPWGLIVNEAMSVGRAVVVSNQVGCWPDLVHDGVNGRVYPAGETDVLAAAIAEVLESPETTLRMGHASAEIIGRWNFQSDLAGLRTAMAASLRRGR